MEFQSQLTSESNGNVTILYCLSHTRCCNIEVRSKGIDLLAVCKFWHWVFWKETFKIPGVPRLTMESDIRPLCIYKQPWRKSIRSSSSHWMQDKLIGFATSLFTLVLAYLCGCRWGGLRGGLLRPHLSKERACPTSCDRAATGEWTGWQGSAALPWWRRRVFYKEHKGKLHE